MKFTPAPWTTETYRKTHGTQLVIQGPELSEGEHEIIAIVHRKGNASLIAASPIMYEELEHAEQTLRNLGNGFLTGDAKTIALNVAGNIKATLTKATS